MSEGAETLGARLRAERERKGLSSQKAADDLHLDGWVIDAIEADDYARIGPSVYGKGHLKRYAELLGLPVGDILSAYEGRSVAPVIGSAVQPSSSMRMRATNSEDEQHPWSLVGAVAVVVLMAAGAVYVWKPWSAHLGTPSTAVVSAAPAPSESADTVAAAATATDTEPVADAPVSLPAPAAIPAKATVVAAAVRPSQVDAPDAQSVPGSGKARLRLSFSADSWVDVHDAAGRRLFAGSGRANSVKTIAGDAPLKVYLGFASGVQMELNSRVVAIGPQFMSGDVARFDAGADGVLRHDAQAAGAAGSSRPRG